MSLEKILERIIDDAQSEADKIILESKKKAAEIKEKAKKQAFDLTEALVKEAEKRGQLEASRIITQARLKKKINTLSRKKELIEEVMEKAFKKVPKGKELKRKIIMKEGESEEPYDEEKLKEELRSKFENEILEALKI
jgi:vacuolar-type H+-ATPase subunit E/Vma4